MERIRLNIDSIAMLLFCARLKAYNQASVTTEEWLLVEKAIRSKGLEGPASLLTMNQAELEDILGLSEFIAYKMIKRITTLNVFLSVLNNLENNGINITTKYETNYPKQFSKQLKKRAPLYLFYCGKLEILKTGISLAGLANVTKKDRTYIKRIISKIKNEDMLYISNDSEGVDEVALRYALQQGCQCAVFVCERLAAKQIDFAKYLKNSQILLLSAEDPNCYYDITNAIDRNSYVCALSKYQIVVSSSINNGASWFTALQNIHNDWTSLLTIAGLYLGNDRLLEMGATPIYDKDILSEMSIDLIYDTNKKSLDDTEVNIDQMSIFDFLGE